MLQTRPDKRVGWLRKRSHRLAFRLNEASLNEQVSVPTAPTRWAFGSLLLIAVSFALGLGMLALVVFGLDLLITRGLGFKVLGVLFILIGIQLRPRVNRLDRSLGLIGRSQAPALFAIVDEVAGSLAQASSSKPVKIELIVVDESYNAWCGRFGLRQRPVLGLGLLLWGSVGPEARIALLAHELGHLVNGDPARGLLSQPAVTTFYRLADLLDPRGMYVVRRSWLPEMFTRLMSYLLLSPICFVLRWIGYLLSVAAARDHRRAEFYADRLAVTAGGTDGLRELLAGTLFQSSVRTAIRRTGSADPQQWQTAASEAVLKHESSLARAEQYSMRVEASLLGSHPPSGLRMRAVRRWPRQTAGLVVAAERFAEADAQLSDDYRRTARALTLS